MMREIKFRGKCIDHTKDCDIWRYGGYANYSIIDEYRDEYDIDPQTLCQFTGLKDKNGVKIYEGDVIEIHHGDGNKTTGVVFYWERFCAVFLMMESGEPRCLFQEWEDFRKCVYAYIQVIGNVFDNPGLEERFGTDWNQKIACHEDKYIGPKVTK